jgi:signal transduction histidine kinase/ligand-binding sensor domain-containing protein
VVRKRRIKIEGSAMTLRGITTPVWWGFVLCLLALGGNPCLGARPYQPVFGDPMLEKWRWRTFPELSGLDALCMAEGVNGTMWFGTANGLWSYDGIEWKSHSGNEIVGRIVTTLCSQTNGSLYVGGGWGISQFSDGQWTRLLSFSGSRIGDIRDIPIKKLATGHDGSLWVATSWGVLHRSPGRSASAEPGRQTTWVLYTDPDTAGRLRQDQNMPLLDIQLLPERVTAAFRRGSSPAGRCDLTEACTDGQGRVWFGATGGEVLCYTPDPVPANAAAGAARGAWSIYNESDGAGSGQVTSILPLQDGTLWVAHASTEQANIFDGRVWQTLRLPLLQPALDMGDFGGRLSQTRDGVVWLAARYMLFAYRAGKWQKYGQPEISYPSTRNVVMQSTDGALWFAGPNTEIHRVDYQTPRWLTLQDLNFQWESPAGVQWFLHRDGRVVVHEAGRWTSHGVEDGLLDMPVALLGTRSGAVWAAGSHKRTAATARFEGGKWTRNLHDDFSFAVDWRAVFESSDGSVWFGAFVDTDGPEKHRDGILQFRDGVWIHHHQPGRSPRVGAAENSATLLPPSLNPDRPIEKFVCLGESRDGKIWAGRNILAFYDGNRWKEFVPTPKMRPGNIEAMLTTREGDLWIGTRESGALRYDGKEWQQFQGKDSLVANSIRSLAQAADGSIWAITDRGSSRFDGRAWMSEVLPEEFNIPHESGGLKASPSGQLWINRYTLYWMRRAWAKSPPPDPEAEFRTVRYQFQGAPPDTNVIAGAKTVSQPGNLSVLWNGVVPWREPKDGRLQFSFRLDDQPWSPFTSDLGHSFFTLPDGHHRLEVRARDQDFNVDPTPATLDFVVLPAVWRQSWFILLMILLGGLIIAQSIRVFLEQGRLRKAHGELEIRVRQRTAELETANRELEAFSYSVSHDLRAPLRSIDGFGKVLLEDYAVRLDEEGRDHLRRVRAAAQRMDRLIEDMLNLSHVTRGELRMVPVNLSRLAQEIAGELARREPERKVRLSIAPDAVVDGDGNLLRIALENLLGNAWKFTAKRAEANVEFGVTEQAGQPVYFVRDDGAGFDMVYAGKLFGAFQRLHSATDFPGTGIGLAIVQRVINRHGGRIWAEAQVDGGASFFFTLGKQAPS